MRFILPCLGLALAGLAPAFAEPVYQVSQYGITWTFDRPVQTGRFVNGDHWIVGPATVVSVSPAPGPSSAEDGPAAAAKSIYGHSALADDRRMRNGSMIVAGPAPRGPKNPTGFDQQGYDSRAINYEPSLSLAFPLRLEPGTSLISTVSSEEHDASGKLSTPYIPGQLRLNLCAPRMPLALRSAAILTCLDQAPPPDAFRPPYAGVAKPIYRASQLRRDLLPALAPVPSTPDWAVVERLFERPWLDHTASWTNQYLLPGENQPNYGREFARFTSIAALMVMLDVPAERRETLLIRYVQLGIDLSGVAGMGRHWFADGGHWQGRKWPLLFASLLLDAPDMLRVPPVDPSIPVLGRITVAPGPDGATRSPLFQEDLGPYYGTGGEGQSALWQIVFHTTPRAPFEEKPRAAYTAEDKLAEGYRTLNATAWVGTALAARHMKAVALWNHDAYFDYMDRWMHPDEQWDRPRWLPAGARHSFDFFTEEMWRAHRDSAPAQPGGSTHLKWVWGNGLSGSLVPNPR